MNKSEEHLLFEKLRMFGGYKEYPNETGFVEIFTHMDMEICLAMHPNWASIKAQAPLLVYDCPEFFSHPDINDYFCQQAQSKEERDLICFGLDGNEGVEDDGHKRHYRLVFYSALNPTIPIAFSSFDLSIIESTPSATELSDGINGLSLKCDFLYAYVLPEHRNMGIGSMLGLSMGTLFWEQIVFVLNQIEGSESALVPVISSDSFTRGGEEILKTLIREVKMFSHCERSKGMINHLIKPTVEVS